MIPTPFPSFVYLVTGYLENGKEYRTWRPHGTDDWLLLATVHGAGEIRGSTADSLIAQPSDIVLIRPHTVHDYRTRLSTTAPYWHFWWTHFHPPAEWLPYLCWPEVFSGILRLSLDGESSACVAVYDALRQMHIHATGALPRREQFAMNSLENAILWCNTVNPLAPQANRDVRVQNAADWLCRHLHDSETTLQAAAAQVGLSPSRLAHLFTAQMSESPAQFLERERIQRACQLLDVTAQPIHEIAYSVGYTDAFYFSARFKKRMGQNPRAFRQRGR